MSCPAAQARTSSPAARRTTCCSAGSGVDDIDGGTGVNYCDSSPDEPAAGSCRYDAAGPEILTLTTNQPSYAPGDQIVVTMHATDATGIDDAAVSFSIDGKQNDFCGQQMQRVTGTAQDGIWKLSCTVPADVLNGTYEVLPYARDVMNNWTNMNGQNPIDLRAHFDLDGGSDDADGPEILTLTTNQQSYTPGDQIVVTMHATDATGIDDAAVSFSIDGKQNDFCGQQMQRVTGTAQDGIWKLSCTVPADVLNGTYEVLPYARDVMNNWTNTNGQNPIDLRAHFDLDGGSDDADGPEILTLTTNQQSYTPGDQMVVTMHATDATGIDEAGVSLLDRRQAERLLRPATCSESPEPPRTGSGSFAARCRPPRVWGPMRRAPSPATS